MSTVFIFTAFSIEREYKNLKMLILIQSLIKNMEYVFFILTDIEKWRDVRSQHKQFSPIWKCIEYILKWIKKGL